jgi:hypothetical protein
VIEGLTQCQYGKEAITSLFLKRLNSTLRFPLSFTRPNREEWAKGYPILGMDL